MTSEECGNVLDPALVNLYGKAIVMTAKYLDKLLHTDEYHRFYMRDNLARHQEPMPADLRNVMLALAGPHARTIWKAYMIRRGLPHDEASYPDEVYPPAWRENKERKTA